MTRPGFEDYDWYDWAMLYFLTFGMIAAGVFSVAWIVKILIWGS